MIIQQNKTRRRAQPSGKEVVLCTQIYHYHSIDHKPKTLHSGGGIAHYLFESILLVQSIFTFVTHSSRGDGPGQTTVGLLYMYTRIFLNAD